MTATVGTGDTSPTLFGSMTWTQTNGTHILNTLNTCMLDCYIRFSIAAQKFNVDPPNAPFPVDFTSPLLPPPPLFSPLQLQGLHPAGCEWGVAACANPVSNPSLCAPVHL